MSDHQPIIINNREIGIMKDNKKYIYVISYYISSSNNLMNTDISSFEVNEWLIE